MFKIIKCYIVTCAMIILLSSDMAQAGKRALEASNVKKSGAAVQGKSRKVAANKDLQAIANRTARASDVTKLDKAAKNWNFTDFNFMGLYEYFDRYIDHVTFIEATQAGDFSSIATLAQALVDNDRSLILSEAKFFIYSVLKASYDRNMEDEREDMLGFELLNQANETMASHTMDVVQYHEPDLGQGYEHTMISNYPNHFLENSEITRVQLANQLSSLVTVINTYANISKKCKQEFTRKEAAKKPQLSELLTYYSKHEHAAVFVFLVSYPLEIETVGDRPMSVETELKRQSFIALKNLWDAAIQSDGESPVAEIAIYLLGMNPLSAAPCSVPKPVSQVQAAAVVSQPVNEEINWNKFKRSRGAEHSKEAFKIFKTYSIKLMKVLQADKAAQYLDSRHVLGGDNLERIQVERIRADKVDFLMHKIIFPAMDTGTTDHAEKLLEYMLTDGDVSEQNIAKSIREELIEASK